MKVNVPPIFNGTLGNVAYPIIRINLNKITIQMDSFSSLFPFVLKA